jgi:hypothetical protein
MDVNDFFLDTHELETLACMEQYPDLFDVLDLQDGEQKKSKSRVKAISNPTRLVCLSSLVLCFDHFFFFFFFFFCFRFVVVVC